MAMPAQHDPAQIEMFLDSRIQERILSAQQQTAVGVRVRRQGLAT